MWLWNDPWFFHHTIVILILSSRLFCLNNDDRTCKGFSFENSIYCLFTNNGLWCGCFTAFAQLVAFFLVEFPEYLGLAMGTRTINSRSQPSRIYWFSITIMRIINIRELVVWCLRRIRSQSIGSVGDSWKWCVVPAKRLIWNSQRNYQPEKLLE